MKSQYKTEIFYNYIIVGVLLILTLSFLLPFIVVLSTSLISEAEWAERGGHVLYPKKISFVAYDILFGKSYVLFNAYQVTFLRVTLGLACEVAESCELDNQMGKQAMASFSAHQNQGNGGRDFSSIVEWVKAQH